MSEHKKTAIRRWLFGWIEEPSYEGSLQRSGKADFTSSPGAGLGTKGVNIDELVLKTTAGGLLQAINWLIMRVALKASFLTGWTGKWS